LKALSIGSFISELQNNLPSILNICKIILLLYLPFDRECHYYVVFKIGMGFAYFIVKIKSGGIKNATI